jgi:Skp family chaperone for outer membrane proteins
MRVFFLLMTCLCLLPAADPVAFRHGVLNLDEVFQTSNLVQDRQKQLKSKFDEVQAASEKEMKVVKDLKVEMEITPKNSPKYRSFEESVKIAEMKTRFTEERMWAEYKTLQSGLLLQSYEDIKRALQDYAQQEKLAMVFMLPNIVASKDRLPDPGQLQQMFSTGTVLYSDPSLNITKGFVAFLNARFPQGKPTTGEAPKTPEAGKEPGK